MVHFKLNVLFTQKIVYQRNSRNGNFVHAHDFRENKIRVFDGFESSNQGTIWSNISFLHFEIDPKVHYNHIIRMSGIGLKLGSLFIRQISKPIAVCVFQDQYFDEEVNWSTSELTFEFHRTFWKRKLKSMIPSRKLVYP